MQLSLRKLCKQYANRKGEPIQAVHDLNLDVSGGQIFGLLGTNGAGKTTTIKMICGLIVPSSGTIKVNEYDVQRQRHAVMPLLGAVLEGTRNVYWRLTAWQNVMYFGRLKRVPGTILSERAERLLRDVGLWERRHNRVATFSRGMQQKVALCCALINDPPLLLLDEPTLGLDVQSARAIKSMLRQLVDASGKSIVITTHQLHIAQEICDRIGIMRQGELIADVPKDELLAMNASNHYEIQFTGNVAALPHAEVITCEQRDDMAVIHCQTDDQTILFDLLAHIRAHDGVLHAVNPKQMTLEEIFIELVAAK